METIIHARRELERAGVAVLLAGNRQSVTREKERIDKCFSAAGGCNGYTHPTPSPERMTKAGGTVWRSGQRGSGSWRRQLSTFHRGQNKQTGGEGNADVSDAVNQADLTDRGNRPPSSAAHTVSVQGSTLH